METKATATAVVAPDSLKHISWNVLWDVNQIAQIGGNDGFMRRLPFILNYLDKEQFDIGALQEYMNQPSATEALQQRFQNTYYIHQHPYASRNYACQLVLLIKRKIAGQAIGRPLFGSFTDPWQHQPEKQRDAVDDVLWGYVPELNTLVVNMHPRPAAKIRQRVPVILTRAIAAALQQIESRFKKTPDNLILSGDFNAFPSGPLDRKDYLTHLKRAVESNFVNKTFNFASELAPYRDLPTGTKAGYSFFFMPTDYLVREVNNPMRALGLSMNDLSAIKICLERCLFSQAQLKPEEKAIKAAQMQTYQAGCGAHWWGLVEQANLSRRDLIKTRNFVPECFEKILSNVNVKQFTTLLAAHPTLSKNQSICALISIIEDPARCQFNFSLSAAEQDTGRTGLSRIPAMIRHSQQHRLSQSIFLLAAISKLIAILRLPGKLDLMGSIVPPVNCAVDRRGTLVAADKISNQPELLTSLQNGLLCDEIAANPTLHPVVTNTNQCHVSDHMPLVSAHPIKRNTPVCKA